MSSIWTGSAKYTYCYIFIASLAKQQHKTQFPFFFLSPIRESLYLIVNRKKNFSQDPQERETDATGHDVLR